MQMIFQLAALVVFAVLGFMAIRAGSRWLWRKWDEREIVSHARKVEREQKRKEAAMRRYSMTDLKPARKS